MNLQISTPVTKPTETIQLHVGCGKIYLPGFVHVDLRPFPHVDHVAPADKLDMFGDNSVDLIYNCHMLEHIRRGKEMGVRMVSRPKTWRRATNRHA